MSIHYVAQEPTMLSRCCPTPLIRRGQAPKSGRKRIDWLAAAPKFDLPSPSLLSFPLNPPSCPLPPSARSLQRLDVLTSIYSMPPPDGGAWESGLGGIELSPVTCVRMPDGSVIQVPVGGEQTAGELLHAACKVTRWLIKSFFLNLLPLCRYVALTNVSFFIES